MELFGIVLSLPAAFVAGPVYTVVLRRLLTKQPRLKQIVLSASSFVLISLVIEWGLLAMLGPVRSRGLPPCQ